MDPVVIVICTIEKEGKGQCWGQIMRLCLNSSWSDTQSLVLEPFPKKKAMLEQHRESN